MPYPLFIRAWLEEPYQYHPLNGESEIRLLSLLPGKWNSIIECLLHHASLDENPRYEALSYVWGGTAKSRNILLDGQVFGVTKNLEVALKHLRHEQKRRLLWVDAIAIDQSNIQERSQQVKIMWRIYKSAKRVLAWLGEEADNSNAAMDLIEEMATACQNDKRETAAGIGLSPQDLIDWGFNADEKDWQPFWRLFERTYWKRVWIIQEQFFSGDNGEDRKDRCRIGCGNRWIRRESVTIVKSYIGIMSANPEAFQSDYNAYEGSLLGLREPLRSAMLYGVSPSTSMFDVLRLARRNRAPKANADCFPTLMQVTREFEATDPRDRVYALLGMNERWKSNFPVDYSKTVDQILKDVVQFAISEDRNLRILEGNRKLLAQNSPTWLPAHQRFFFAGRPWVDEGLYRSSGNLSSETPRFNDDGSVIITRGIIVGTISNALGPFRSTVTMRPVERHEYWQNIFRSIKLYRNGISIDRHETFWRTLLLDQINKVFPGKVISPAPKEFGSMAEILFADTPFSADHSEEPPPSEHMRSFVSNLGSSTIHRCFFDTDTGYMGIGPFHTKPGDLVAVFIGGSFCFVLRPKGQCYELIGDAYVHGAMNGELVNLDEQGNIINVQDFNLC